MDKDAIIRQLQDAIDQLERENELLRACIKELRRFASRSFSGRSWDTA